MGWQAASGLWDSNGAGNRYMDALLSGGEPASLRAYGGQLREIAAELRILEAELHRLSDDLAQAWPEGTARTSWVRLAHRTSSAFGGLYRAIDVGEDSLVGVTDRAASKIENTQTSSMTKSVIVNAILGVLNSNPYTEGLVSPTGIAATIETIAELAEVANTINTFYTLYENIAGDEETASVPQAQAANAAGVPLATSYVPTVPATYTPGTTFGTAPAGMVYAPTPEIPSSYQQPATTTWPVPATGFPDTGYPSAYPGTYPGPVSSQPGGGAPLPTGTGNGIGTALPSGDGTGTGTGGVPGFVPVDPPAAVVPGEPAPAPHEPADPVVDRAGGSEVTVTVRDGDASFEIVTGRDGQFTQTLHGEAVTVNVDLASDESALTRTA